MLFDVHQTLKPRQFFDQPLRGIVVDNNDPRGISRVRCQIPPFIMSDDVSALPWVYAQVPADQGGGSGTSSFGVPILGSEVIIEFPTKDPHFPVYTGFWKSDTTQQVGESAGDYPNNYGFVDAAGNKYLTNLAKGTFTYIHSSGSTVNIDAGGNATFKITGNLIQQVAGNMTIQVAGNYKVTAAKISLNE